MSQIDYLLEAKIFFEKKLSLKILSIKLLPLIGQLNITFRDGNRVYIKYNNHQEYSYAIIFSKSINDRCRFDNFDKNWEVKSKPHHFHSRFSMEGIASPMIGHPSHDIPLFIRYYESCIIYNPKITFNDNN